MVAHDGGEVDVGGQAAAAEADIVLLDVADIALHGDERVDDAGILPAAVVKAEGGQQAQAAALAGHVPLLAGADVVEQ